MSLFSKRDLIKQKIGSDDLNDLIQSHETADAAPENTLRKEESINTTGKGVFSIQRKNTRDFEDESPGLKEISARKQTLTQAASPLYDYTSAAIPKYYFLEEEFEYPIIYQLWCMISSKLRKNLNISMFENMLRSYLEKDECMSDFYVGSLSDGNPYYFFGSSKGNLIFINLFVFHNTKSVILHIAKIDDCPIKGIDTYDNRILTCSQKGKIVIIDFRPEQKDISDKLNDHELFVDYHGGRIKFKVHDLIKNDVRKSEMELSCAVKRILPIKILNSGDPHFAQYKT